MEFGKYEKARIILMDILSVMGGDEEITRYLQHLYQLENEAAIAKLAGKIFPWPPPVASASARIPRSYLKQPDQKYVTLKDAAHKLNIALEKCGYYEKSYFWVPGGFALVTRMERIYPDGTPYENEDRWSAELNPLNKFSLVDIIKALFTANQGHFRIIVFIVSSRFNRMDTAKILTQKEAVQLLPTGWTDLPDFIGEMEYKELNYCRALIYEFVKQNNQEAVLKLPSDLQGPDHLRKAKIYMALKE
jgi:hypothetical protein